MNRSFWHHRATWLAMGLVAGLVISGSWPYSPAAHATATDRHENFAICTGSVGGGLEGVYVLDFLTGDLMAGVLSPQTGTFNAYYRRNIVADLGVVPAQGPRYLMVSGTGTVQARGAGRAAQGILYVAELTTGKIAAYTVPWAGNLAGGQVVQSSFALLDVKPFRNPKMVRPGAVPQANN